jgi:hypothetical protein
VPIALDDATFDPLTGDLVITSAIPGAPRLRLAGSLLLEADAGAGWCPEHADPGAFLAASARRFPAGAVAAYCAGLPAGVLAFARVAGPFELTALRFFRLCGRPAFELAASAPNLFWLLAMALGREEIDYADARVLVAKKRAAILSRVTALPAKPELVRTLEKIQLDRRVEEERRVVIAGLATPHVLRSLRDRNSMNIATLRRLERLRTWTSARWLSEVIARSDQGRDLFGEARGAADDTESLGIALGLREPQRIVERARSLAALRILHDRWAAQHRRAMTLAKVEADRRLREPFDDPGIVFAEEPRYRRLRTPAEVMLEGLEMEHCAGAYVERCRTGEVILFHVESPPATLELRVERGRVRIGQLLGPKNARVSEECAEGVTRWVAQARFEPLQALARALEAAQGIEVNVNGGGMLCSSKAVGATG